jgi:glyoxylase-like metal-dependent hydrolase (beta-lactamase superfamily II)
MHALRLIPFVCLAFSLVLSAQDVAGIRRFKIGSLEVTAILDGEVKLKPELLKGIDAAGIKAMLGSEDPATTSVNAFLVRMGKHLVLVDAGGRPDTAPGSHLGHVVERLQAVGIDPGSIEAVLITHFHSDHIGGLLTADDKMAFPHAQLRMAQAEYDYWMDPALEAQASEQRKASLRAVKSALAPYQTAGLCRPFKPGEEPFPGVTAMPAPGHTPGHTVYVFGKGKDSLWAMGDIVHFEKVQFPRPEITVSFDTDSRQAAATRIDLWRRAAQQGAVLAGAHIAFPGMGHVVARGDGFEWKPLPQ